MAERKRREPKVAVALRYDRTADEAPKVVASGKGEVADALLRIATEHSVPIREDHPLAGALARLEVGAAIPPELYAAVAEVLAFLWRLEDEKGARGWGEARPR